MASQAATLDKPEGVIVRPGSVSATNVDVAATNGCVMMTFTDKTQLKAFVSGLDSFGTKFDRTGDLTIRFFLSGR